MSLVTTTKGDLDESLLTRKVVEQDEGDVIVTAREWYLGAEMVRRDVNVTIKRGLDMTSTSYGN